MGPDGGRAQVRAEFDPIGGLLCAVAGRRLPVVSEVAQAVNSSRERAGSPGRCAPLSGQRPTAAFISGSCRSRSSSIASSCPHAIADEISGHGPSGCLLRPPGGEIHNTISMTYLFAVLFGLARQYFQSLTGQIGLFLRAQNPSDPVSRRRRAGGPRARCARTRRRSRSPAPAPGETSWRAAVRGRRTV